MLRNKFFWIAVSLIIPFIVVWVMEGLLWAITTYFIAGALLLMAITGTRHRRTVYYYDEDDYDEGDIEVRRPQRRPSNIEEGARWHIPTINQKGVDFLTKSKGRKRKFFR